jgi:ribonuclease-3
MAPKKIFGIRFKNTLLLEAALMHPSYRNETPGAPRGKHENFDRLEFLGDALLNEIICRRLYALYPEADEGGLSRLRSIIVSRRILSRIARELGLPKYVKLGGSLIRQKQFLKAKIYADALEAFFAALYFDQGPARTERFILRAFRNYFDARRLFRLDPNPKSTLQELAQRHWRKLPLYSGEFAEGRFKITVAIDRQRRALASGRSRRDAEDKAARLLIRSLRQELVGRLNKKSSGKKLRSVS